MTEEIQHDYDGNTHAWAGTRQYPYKKICGRYQGNGRFRIFFCDTFGKVCATISGPTLYLPLKWRTAAIVLASCTLSFSRLFFPSARRGREGHTGFLSKPGGWMETPIRSKAAAGGRVPGPSPCSLSLQMRTPGHIGRSLNVFKGSSGKIGNTGSISTMEPRRQCRTLPPARTMRGAQAWREARWSGRKSGAPADGARGGALDLYERR